MEPTTPRNSVGEVERWLGVSLLILLFKESWITIIENQKKIVMPETEQMV